MDADHRKQLDCALFLASQAVLLVILIPAYVPQPAKVIAFLAVGWYFYHTILTQTTGDPNHDFGFGTGLIIEYMAVLDYAFLTPPENLKDLRDGDPTRVTQRPLKKRILWALKLFSNGRGIGWAHEPSHLPPRPSPSTPRSTFVISRILHATFYYLILAGGTRLVDTTYARVVTTEKLLIDAPLHWRVIGVLSFGLAIIGSVSGAHTIVAASVVGCGFSSPERWPLLFGSPLQAWSIKGFWRVFWHQLIRRSVLSCTTSLLGCIFPAKYVGTTGYRLAQFYTVFFFSGLGHLGGDVMASGKLSFRSFAFFMLQPIGITIELVVSYLWRRIWGDVPNPKQTSVPPLWVRCIGFVWVTVWMVWTGAYTLDALYSARVLAESRDNRALIGGSF